MTRRTRSAIVWVVIAGLAVMLPRPWLLPVEQAQGIRPAAAPGLPDASIRAQILGAHGRLPLSFEVNRGQTDPRVRFLARGRGYRLFLTSEEAVIVLNRPQHTAVLRIRPVGTDATHTVSGEEAVPGVVHYLIGNDPAKWRTNVPTYARVRYRSVYPGIDLVYYGNQGELEFDFVVSPGADPRVIALRMVGADHLDVDAHGDLVVQVAGGTIRQRKPLVYQEIDGTRREIAAGYVLTGAGQVGFRISAYDARRPLIIDPVLAYSTYLGGSSDESAAAVAVDAGGNAYVTGQTASANFPTTGGSYDTTANGGTDAFVTKFRPSGPRLYSTYLGGSGDDSGLGIGVDTSGNAYVTGQTASMDFPVLFGAFDPTANGATDAFVAKLNASGSGLTYSTYLGGSGADAARAIAVDGSGNAYVTGQTASGNFPTTGGTYDTSLGGPTDAFVTKFNPSGASLAYSTFLGGGNSEDGRGIALDGSGNAYVTGETASGDFPTTGGALDTTLGGATDAFVTKVTVTGSALVYSTFLGGSSSDSGAGIVVDAAGAAYVTGETASGDFPTTGGAFDTLLGGASDAFVTKLNAAGTSAVFSTYLGGSGADAGNAIAVNSAGSAFVTGRTASGDFPTVNAAQGAFGGATDAFVTRLNPSGTAPIYSTYLGGTGSDVGNGIGVDAQSNAYVIGQTASANFPVANASQLSLAGPTDAFVARLTGVVTVALFNPSTNRFFLKNTNSGGPADVTFIYGPAGAGWTPITGDWNGDGIDTAGVYDPTTGTFFLKNSNSAGPADLTFVYGPGGVGWIPVVGDWDGNGTDTVGLFNTAMSAFFLKNSNSPGPADLTFVYGPAGAGWVPVAGDWDGNGTDTVGLYNPGPSIFFLKNSNAAGPADVTFGYGPPGAGWTPLAGDWDGNGVDSIGLHNPATSTFFLKNLNTAGVASTTFVYGPAGSGWLPLAGDWDGS